MTSDSNNVALVTGASRGIGRAIALSLARDGIKVALNYSRDEVGVHETASLVKKASGFEPFVSRFDVSVEKDVKAGVDLIEKQLGAVNVLINNAGVAIDGLLVRIRKEEWDKTIGVNLTGAFNCSKICARGMMKNRWGRIINITSVVGEMGNAGQVAYSAAKAGLIGLTKSMAKELASRKITVNAIAPGYIQTDMTSNMSEAYEKSLLEKIPLKVSGTAEDVADCAAFLISSRARYVTGHVLAVNGGLYM